MAAAVAVALAYAAAAATSSDGASRQFRRTHKPVELDASARTVLKGKEEMEEYARRVAEIVSLFRFRNHLALLRPMF